MPMLIPHFTPAGGACCRKSVPRVGFRLTQSERIIAKQPFHPGRNRWHGAPATLSKTFAHNALGICDRRVA